MAYSITINTNEQEYKTSGSTILEALQNFDTSPFKVIKTKTIIRCEGGGKRSEVVLWPVNMRRVWFGMRGTSMTLLAKRLGMFLK